jgi:hypothetical protein
MENFEEIKELLINSFKPFKCQVTKYDYDEFIKFRLKDESNDIIIEREKISYDMTEVNAIIFEIRQLLIDRGYKFD